jgi:hypothetical protein
MKKISDIGVSGLHVHFLTGSKWSNGQSNKKGAAVYYSVAPVIIGEPCRDRTDNLLIKSQLLYQLS